MGDLMGFRSFLLCIASTRLAVSVDLRRYSFYSFREALQIEPEGNMGRADGIPHAIAEQNGRKHFIQRIAFTGTGVNTALGTTDVYSFAVPLGCCLVLQADQDFLYELRTDSGATHVTVQSGARAGVYVSALQQEFVVLHSGDKYGTDTYIDVIAASASGNLNVFWVG